jgi:short-subunit dehydrogenase
MKKLAGSAAIVTGASRGIGVLIAEALVRRGVRLALVARSAEELGGVSRRLEGAGAEVLAIPADVTDPGARARIVDETVRAFGAVDLLVNNAGVVLPSAYERLSAEELDHHIAVNLTAPLDLTRRVLPLMLERGRGHVVNVASLGGLIGAGWCEPYSATKHGLVGFTRSLRVSCKASGVQVSASVVCPGFVDGVGMYVDSVRGHGRPAPIWLGTSSAEAVAAAVVRAIERDRPEVIVSPGPVRLLLMLGAISPRLGEWLLRRLGGHLVFEADARAAGRDRRQRQAQDS